MVKALHLVPLIGPMLAMDVPSFEQLEKLLQIMALLSGLALGCVSGLPCKSGDDGCTKEVVDAAYNAFELCGFNIMWAVVLYVAIVIYGDKSVDGDKGQLRHFWKHGGNLMFCLLPVSLMFAMINFVIAVTTRFQHQEYEDFNFGLFKSPYTMPGVLVVLTIIVQVMFATAPDGAAE